MDAEAFRPAEGPPHERAGEQCGPGRIKRSGDGMGRGCRVLHVLMVSRPCPTDGVWSDTG